MKREDTLPAPILKAFDAIGARMYRSTWRANPKHEAQEHLTGRTHYVDGDTLRYFHSRILAVDLWAGGAVCVIRESVALDSKNQSRGQRFVAFDIFGEVLQRESLDDCKTTEAAARKRFSAWAEGFDLAAHYRDKLTGMHNTFCTQARDIARALSETATAES